MKTKILTTVFAIAFLSIFSVNAQEHDHSKMKMEMDSTKMGMSMDSTKTDMKHSSMKMDHSEMEMKNDTAKMKMDHSKIEVKPVYTCSMHPEILSDKKGECPKCGMDLIENKMEVKKI